MISILTLFKTPMLSKRQLWTRMAVFLVMGFMASYSLQAHADAPSLQILDRVDAAFKPLQNTWYTAIKAYAQNLFWALVLVDFGWSAVIYVLEKSDFMEIATSMAKKIFSVGFFWMLLKMSDTWIPAIINSFRQIGTTVGNVSSVTPDGIATTGFELAKSSFQIMKDLNTLEAIAVVFPVTLIAIVMFLSFLFVAAQLLVTLIETYICVGAGVILLGFGGSRWTTDFATKYLQYAVGTGLKLMILYLIVGAGQTLFDQIMLDPDNLIETCLAAMGSALVYAYLAIQIPAIAQAMISGSPSLTAGGMAGSAIALGAAVAGAGAATMATAGAGAAGAVNGVAGASGLAKALGAGLNSGMDAGKSGFGLAAHATGEVAKHGLGLGTEALGSAVNSAKTTFADKVESSTGGQIASSIEATRGGNISGASQGGESKSSGQGSTATGGGDAVPASAPQAPAADSADGAAAATTSSPANGSASGGANAAAAPSPSAKVAPPSVGGSAAAGGVTGSTSASAPAGGSSSAPPPAGSSVSPAAGDASTASLSGPDAAQTQQNPATQTTLSDRIQGLQGYVPQDMAAGGGSINLDLHHTQD